MGRKRLDRATIISLIGWVLLITAAIGAFLEFEVFGGRHGPIIYDLLFLGLIAGFSIQFWGATIKTTQSHKVLLQERGPNFPRLAITVFAIAFLIFFLIRCSS